jgi:sulfatase modifying factor 1
MSCICNALGGRRIYAHLGTWPVAGISPFGNVGQRLTSVASVWRRLPARLRARFGGQEVPAQAADPTELDTAARNDGDLILAPGVVLELVRAPAGRFLMGKGSPEVEKRERDEAVPWGEDYESPFSFQSGGGRLSEEFLEEYFIGKSPVTVAQWAAFVKATGYVTEAERQGTSWGYDGSTQADIKGANWQHPRGPGSDVSQKQSHPVTHVTWNDAVAFTEWAARISGREVRLPTEAEWEKAARGTDGREYPWGNEPPDETRCNHAKRALETTTVGKYSPLGDSPYGAQDMSGNVWEWTTPYYSSLPFRVLRGGSFYWNPYGVRTTDRSAHNDPSRHTDEIGFRVVVWSAAHSVSAGPAAMKVAKEELARLLKPSL